VEIWTVVISALLGLAAGTVLGYLKGHADGEKFERSLSPNERLAVRMAKGHVPPRPFPRPAERSRPRCMVRRCTAEALPDRQYCIQHAIPSQLKEDFPNLQRDASGRYTKRKPAAKAKRKAKS